MAGKFTRLNTVTPRKVEWLWEHRVPLGEVTILEGHPGTNKSSLTNDIAARLTRGQPMPCVQSPQGGVRSGGVLFLIGEDSISKTVLGRLTTAGADLNRIGVLQHVTVPEDIADIEKAVLDLGAKLIVVDSMNDFLNCSATGNRSVRQAFEPLRELADKHNLAVVLIRHFTKGSAGDLLLRGGGSVAVTAVARSQLKVYKDPANEKRRFLVQDKSNLGPLSPPLSFEVMPTSPGLLRLHWHGICELPVLTKPGRTPAAPKAQKGSKLVKAEAIEEKKPTVPPKNSVGWKEIGATVGLAGCVWLALSIGPLAGAIALGLLCLAVGASEARKKKRHH